LLKADLIDWDSPPTWADLEYSLIAINNDDKDDKKNKEKEIEKVFKYAKPGRQSIDRRDKI